VVSIERLYYPKTSVPTRYTGYEESTAFSRAKSWTSFTLSKNCRLCQGTLRLSELRRSRTGSFTTRRFS
jgi:hypothetical protein